MQTSFQVLQNNARIIVNTLKAVKPYIWDGKGSNIGGGKERFVCCCIQQHGFRTTGIYGGGNTKAVARYVQSALKGFYTFENWLRDSIGYQQYSTLSIPDIQALRVKWVDKMISDLTKKYNL